MFPNKFLCRVKATCRIGPYVAPTTIQRLAAYGHDWAYRLVLDAKSIVVIGGSFAGTELFGSIVPLGQRMTR